MKLSKVLQPASPQMTDASTNKDTDGTSQSVVRRRVFLRGLGIAGVALPAAALSSTSLFASAPSAESDDGRSPLSRGDVAILKFLAAAEIIESDLWIQYNELGGVKGGNAAYVAALSNLDADMPQYITDNTDDELSHTAFINAYLKSKGETPINFDRFRTLPSSRATGAKQIGRLTNLLNLDVDTSWYTRYRSEDNLDFGQIFKGPITITNEPAIPLDDDDTPPTIPQPVPPLTPQARRMQAIANTAGFHFAYIEQGGSSLYTSMSLKATSSEVLRIIVSIGGVEVNHFAIWHDKVGNAVSQPLAGVTDPGTGLTFPDLNAPPRELTQTNKILPEPCDFIKREGLPPCSVIRPSLTEHAGAVATIRSFTADRLFQGQSDEFLDLVMKLAVAADAAQRES